MPGHYPLVGNRQLVPARPVEIGGEKLVGLLFRRSIWLLAAALMAALPAPALAATHSPGWHEVGGLDSVYVRSNPNGFAIGTLFNSKAHIEHPHTDRFFLKPGVQERGGYVWGFAEGEVDGCGWISAHGIPGPGRAGAVPGCAVKPSTATGSGSRRYLLDHYAYTTNDYGPGKVRRLKGRLINSASSTRAIKPTPLFGNYDQRTGQFHDRYTDPSRQIKIRDVVGWRWVTKDRKAVMVHFADTWGFVPIDALTRGLNA